MQNYCKRILSQMFSQEFWEVFKNNYFSKHLWTTASVTLKIAEKATTWKVPKYGVFSGPQAVRMRENADQKKLRIWALFTQWALRWMLLILMQFDSLPILSKLKNLIHKLLPLNSTPQCLKNLQNNLTSTRH